MDLAGKVGGLDVAIGDGWDSFEGFKLRGIINEIDFKLTGSRGSGGGQEGFFVFEGFLFEFDVFGRNL